MSSIQVTAQRVMFKSLVTNDERKLKILNSSDLLQNNKIDSQPNGSCENNSSTHVNEERPFGLDQVKSKFASIRYGKSNIKGFMTMNSLYLNGMLVIFEIKIEMYFLF
jgi:hypothetical protein